MYICSKYSTELPQFQINIYKLIILTINLCYAIFNVKRLPVPL